MTRSILVPLDGSSFGEHALPAAISLARRSGGKIHLLNVHTLLDATYAEIQFYEGSLDDEMRRTELAYLQKTKQEIEVKTGVTVTTHHEVGDVVSIIRQKVKELEADLVVMTTHGRGPVGRFWLGSMADDLVRDLDPPLLLIHPKKGAPNLLEEMKVEHVLIPLSGAPFAERILGTAESLAKLAGADLTLMKVLKPIYPVSLPTEPGPLAGAAYELMDKIEEVQEQMKNEAQAYLEGVASRLRNAGIVTRTHVSVEAEPGSAILEQAHKPIDLITMETHGRHGLSRLFLGSVADKVIRHSTLPILVHSSHE